ncbi:hypothetical protein IAQ61_003481 [Plenodomus lingam]|uniref:uncharacterized protein n=1 Tax=Leptosphaeria maculans TaxID=5022 RepID=UPI003322938C|nr:hypothetical protein IAQ61_003481 [Plenodomus lingam]
MINPMPAWLTLGAGTSFVPEHPFLSKRPSPPFPGSGTPASPSAGALELQFLSLAALGWRSGRHIYLRHGVATTGLEVQISETYKDTGSPPLCLHFETFRDSCSGLQADSVLVDT